MQLRAASMALIQWKLLAALQLLALASLSSAQIGSEMNFENLAGSGLGSGFDSTDSPFTKPTDQEDGDTEDDAFPFDHDSVDICLSPPHGMLKLCMLLHRTTKF